MDLKSLARGLVACAVCMVGCGDPVTEIEEGAVMFPARDLRCADGVETPCATDTPSRTEAQRTVVPPEGEARTVRFVFSTFQLPTASTDAGSGLTRAAGFNVDGIDSGDGTTTNPDATCQDFNPDFVGLNDVNHDGVDNALQGFVSSIEALLADSCPGGVAEGCLDATLQEQINSGSLLILVEVAGVNDLTYDPEVSVQLSLGAVPGGGMPDVGDNGRLADGQSFDVDRALGEPVQGDIFEGRLRVATPLLPILITVGDLSLTLNVTQAQLRFDISDNGLSAGVLGGVVAVEDIVSAASEFMPELAEPVRGLVVGVADVSPTDDPTVCSALSLGGTFQGVNASF